MQAVPALFQSTHPRRVWLYYDFYSNSQWEFQSTHPRRVWRLIRLVLILIASFNPHTHAGCDSAWLARKDVGNVSIHTPTQGVTSDLSALSIRATVSIHTPTQGVTGRRSALLDQSKVSIHTPTQGVTLTVKIVKLWCLFQSTHPRRVWLFLFCYTYLW